MTAEGAAWRTFILAGGTMASIAGGAFGVASSPRDSESVERGEGRRGKRGGGDGGFS